MSIFRSWFKRLFQFIGKPFWTLMQGLQGLKDPHKQLKTTCTILQHQLEQSQNSSTTWKSYTKALTLARRCDRTALVQIIHQFDPQFRGSAPSKLLDRSVGQSLSYLLDAKPQISQNLDAAWCLCQRLPDTVSIQKTEQQICIQIARIGDDNMLLAKLFQQQQNGLLNPEDLSQVLKTYLERHSFSVTDPWKSFLSQLPLTELPPIHQVYAVLGRYVEASDFAEVAKDYRSAIHYLDSFSDQESALRRLALSHRLGDNKSIADAHQCVAEIYWQEQSYIEALEHFQTANNLERASDCHQALGGLERAIQMRPTITPEWRQSIRNTLEQSVHSHLESQDFLAAVRLLKSIEQAWRSKSDENEADRTKYLLSEVVRTAHTAFQSEVYNTQGQTPLALYKRWSLLEEAAGNYLEAGLKAELAQDYFAASLLFEKAEAFGQALFALESANLDDLDPRKKAQLLEQGGDFFLAGLLYERSGDIDKALALYEQAEEFSRAAALRKTQIGNKQILFDDHYQDLITKAGQLEDLAELCISHASARDCPADQKSRLWRRVHNWATRGLIRQKWLELTKNKLPELERPSRQDFEDKAATWLQIAHQNVIKNYSNAIGLDLGTSNSVVCLFNKKSGEAEVVNWQGQQQIPSIFAIDQSGIIKVGIPIPKLLIQSPRAIITKAKREMGTNRKFRAGGQDYRPEEISAHLINHALQRTHEYLQQKIAIQVSELANQSIGYVPPSDWVHDYLERHLPVIPIKQSVITVPAYFNDAQKQATKMAAALADIPLLRLIHEPTAACLAHWFNQDKPEIILVADLGAGTFDLSLIQSGDGIFEVLQIEGDNALGSADLDELIYKYFEEYVAAQVGQEIPRNSQASTRLTQACEELKIELSSRTAWSIELPYLVGDHTVQLTLTRQDLEKLASSWLHRLRTACEKIKHHNNRCQPKRILLIGGGAITPAVRRCIQDIFHIKPVTDLDPLTAVARGAVLQAAMLIGDLQDVLLMDATPFSLGIKCQTEPGKLQFESIIPKHRTIPVDKSKIYTTIEDSQTQVRIEIFQGESSVPEENFKIGEFILEGIPIAKAGVPQIEVTFDIDVNCLLTVVAKDVKTGNQKKITISDSHLLTPAQAASLQVRFQDARVYQTSRTRLEKTTTALVVFLEQVEKADLAGVSQRFQDRIQTYERYHDHYLPTASDNDILLEIFREREHLDSKTRLALDQWDTLSRSAHVWLGTYRALNWKSADISHQIQLLVEEGNRLQQRTELAERNIVGITAQYQQWLSVIEGLPLNPKGNAEELAKQLLALKRYSEALEYFNQFDTPLSHTQAELGLELLGRSRQRAAYETMLNEYAQVFNIYQPDFQNLNHAVRIYAASAVLIEANWGESSASGSGFFIDADYIATNSHVLMDGQTGKCVGPDALSVMTGEGALQVLSIHLPSWGLDDVAILQVSSSTTTRTPLRLGFSELVEVGERIMTVGFPAPEQREFAENLYCNIGLVNRIRKSPACTERVLEVSIPLQGGISGSPLLNQLGEVIGLLTFTIERNQFLSGGQTRSELSFYAVPVEILHRLHAEVKN